MNFDDPFVRAFSRVILFCLVLALLAIGAYVLAIPIDWYRTGSVGPGNEDLARLSEFLPKLSGEQVKQTSNIVAILVSAVPLMVTPTCFLGAENGSRRLNLFGILLAVALTLGLAVSAAAYITIDPAGWGAGHVLGADGLAHVQDWAKTVLRGAVFYLAALFALKSTK